jgi:hypothetical protein
MQLKNIDGIYVSTWQQSVSVPILDHNNIQAILCISKNKKRELAISTYTVLGIQHYSANIDGLSEDKLEEELIRIYKIINWFHSNKINILVHSNEESIVPFCITYYFIRSYYFNGEKIRGAKKPEIPVTSDVIVMLEKCEIDNDIDHQMLQSLYKFENKYIALSNT